MKKYEATERLEGLMALWKSIKGSRLRGRLPGWFRAITYMEIIDMCDEVEDSPRGLCLVVGFSENDLTDNVCVAEEVIRLELASRGLPWVDTGSQELREDTGGWVSLFWILPEDPGKTWRRKSVKDSLRAWFCKDCRHWRGAGSPAKG